MACEQDEGRAGGDDLARRPDPARVLDLDLLGEVDLLSFHLLAQDAPVDDRHDVSTKLAHEFEAPPVRIWEVDEYADGIIGRERLAYGRFGRLGMAEVACRTDALLIDGAQELESAGTAR